MAKPKKIIVDQIWNRRTRGYAFSGMTTEEKLKYRTDTRAEIVRDLELMTDADFRKKYEQYIY